MCQRLGTNELVTHNTRKPRKRWSVWTLRLPRDHWMKYFSTGFRCLWNSQRDSEWMRSHAESMRRLFLSDSVVFVQLYDKSHRQERKSDDAETSAGDQEASWAWIKGLERQRLTNLILNVQSHKELHCDFFLLPLDCQRVRRKIRFNIIQGCSRIGVRYDGYLCVIGVVPAA